MNGLKYMRKAGYFMIFAGLAVSGGVGLGFTIVGDIKGRRPPIVQKYVNLEKQLNQPIPLNDITPEHLENREVMRSNLEVMANSDGYKKSYANYLQRGKTIEYALGMAISLGFLGALAGYGLNVLSDKIEYKRKNSTTSNKLKVHDFYKQYFQVSPRQVIFLRTFIYKTLITVIGLTNVQQSFYSKSKHLNYSSNYYI